MSLQNNFTAVYDDKAYQYTTTVRHKGTVLAFAMDTQQRIYYTALDNSSAEASLLDKNNWLKEPQELTFPTEIRQLGYGGFDQTTMPTVKKNGEVVIDVTSLREEEKDTFLSSTARFTANVPFHVVSDEKHIYVFRQAIGLPPSGSNSDVMVYKQKADGSFEIDEAGNKIPLVNHTLLLDRFVLAGTTLQRKLEVRYQRSRSKEFPQSSKDSLSAKDMEGKPFYEPTLEIEFIRDLEQGRFTVLLLPTYLPDVYRWQIFAYNSRTQLIDAYNIQQSSEGLFDLRGTQLPDSSPIPRSALSLRNNDYLALPKLSDSDSGTFECWIKFDSFDDQIILDASTSAKSTEPRPADIVKYFFVDIKQKQLRFWLEDAADNDFQGAIADLKNYQPNQWYHLAIVWNYNTPEKGAVAQIYLNGTLAASHTASRAGARPVLRNPYLGKVRHEMSNGQPPEKSLMPFQGEVDEVRLWNMSRTAAAIKASIGIRLLGDRPGLVGYWRFGGVGNTVPDQTSYGNKATLVYESRDDRPGPWIPSTAPISENLEKLATSFQFGDRKLISGLSALLYFQQEPFAGGYDRAQKPLKMGARVMLVAATQQGFLGKKRITALDFGVSREGKLAQVSGSLGSRALLERSYAGSINEDLAAISKLETGLSLLRDEISQLQLAMALSKPDHDTFAVIGQGSDTQNATSLTVGTAEWPGSPIDFVTLDPALRIVLYEGPKQTGRAVDLWQSVSEFNPGFVVRSLEVIRQDNDLKSYRLQALSLEELKQRLLQKETLRDEQEQQLSELKEAIARDIDQPLLPVAMDPTGLTVFGAVLDFTETSDTPLLFDSANSKLILYYRGRDDQFSSVYYDTKTAKAEYLLNTSSGTSGRSLKFIARTAGSVGDHATIDIAGSEETCTLTLTNLTLGVKEVWPGVSRDVAKVAAILNGKASTDPNDANYYNYDNVEILSYNAGDFLPMTQADPQKGSLLFVAEETLGTERVLNQSLAGTSKKTLTSRWQGLSPGHSLLLNGDNAALRLADPSHLAKFAPEQDLTLEAWMNPISSSTRALVNDRVIHYCAADGSGYTLGLAHESMLFTAIQLNQHEVCLRQNLNLANQSFTIEFWAKRQTARAIALEAIASHGDRPNPAGLFIGFERSNFVFSIAEKRLETWLLDADVWHHWACTFDARTQKFCIYKDGKLMAEDHLGADYLGVGELWLGTAIIQDIGGVYFRGNIDEFRLWSEARTPQQIQATLYQPLRHSQANLLGCWVHTNPGQESIHCIANQILGNADPDLWATIHGSIPKSDTSAISLYRPFVSVGSKAVQTRQQFPLNTWTHIAAVFNQSYALKFDGVDASLDCGTDISLDINRDMTIEMFVQLDINSLDQPRGLLTKGIMDDGTEQNVPYSLYISQEGKLVFAFEDTENRNHEYVSNSPLIDGEFYRLAVTRAYKSEVDSKGNVTEGDTITFYVNGVNDGSHFHQFKRGKSTGAGNSNQRLLIGMTYLADARPAYFKGAISEVRIWNGALNGSIGASITGQEKGLVSWWRFEENKGAIAYDSKSSNHGTRSGGTRWIKNPDPNGSSLTVYCNGEPVLTDPLALGEPLSMGSPQFTLGAYYNHHIREALHGYLEDVRVWKVARTQEQIQDNLFQRLTSDYESLIAYYPFDESSNSQQFDHSYNLLHLVPDGYPSYVYSTAPVSEDIPQIRDGASGVKTAFNDVIHSRPGVQEYGDLQYDIDNNLIGILKRCHTFIRNGQWHLLTGYKVGNLETEWIGQVQFAPQLIGFIEGAPPVPGENLSIKGADYTGATSVELLEADNTVYTYSASRENGFDMSAEYSAGVGINSSNDITSGIGLVDSLTEIDFKLGSKMTFENSLGYLNDATIRTGKRNAKSSRLDLRGEWKSGRFVPRNVGYALVQSETADVFALRMKHNGALVSYQMRPNPDIPKDWNVITFPINPFYTKQGTLDGKVGLEPDVSYPNAMAAYSNNSSYFKPLEAYGLKNRIRREEEILKSQYEQYDAGAIGRKQKGDLASTDDLMKELPNVAKRNIVNTYVWTADGGLFSESEETMDVRQETSGGSYTFTGKAGIASEGDFTIFKARVYYELELLFGGHLNLTASKSKESETGFSIKVNVDGVESNIYERDANGQVIWDDSDAYLPEPRKVPGKVDAYRFMTFYLQGKEEYFDDFVNKVVDFKWLNTSNHPNAIALRQAVQAQAAAKDQDKSLPWRIMHRVTFCSRVLPKIQPINGATPLERTMIDLKIDSTWQLVKILEPFVQGKTGIDFNTAVEQAINHQIPELKPHKAEIIRYMRLYYNLDAA